MFMSCIMIVRGRKVNLEYLSDWRDPREVMWGKHRALLPFGKEVLATLNWTI